MNQTSKIVFRCTVGVGLIVGSVASFSAAAVGALPADVSDPSTVTAVPATSWADVKYAFCSAQGRYGVLVDFQGTDLSKTTTGKFSFGVRSCQGTDPFTWGDVLAFQSNIDHQTLTLDFGTSLMPSNCFGCSNDTIQVNMNLNRYTQGYGVLGGNSGPCVFLMNKATGGLFESDPNFSCK